ncbi:MAG: hypothetical protein LBF38_02875 [Deltaproteobacteria bacterium]|jgi:hypothetical protein|nr:hypothetical protein [Deltaproteobacteria bacterium]
MKIINFNPPVTKVENQTDKPPRPSDSFDFESILNKIPSKTPGQNTPNVVDKITRENQLACQGAAVEDVGLAGSLLNTLVSQIKASQSETLLNVHNLEGILYYYQL